MKILKNLLIAISLVVLIVLLANLIKPDNSLAIGSGFTRTIPAVNYPSKASFAAALLWFGGAFFLQKRQLYISYFLLLLILAVYTVYCSSHYIQ